MNLIQLAPRIQRSARRKRRACLAVESMENRLALSPTVPLPPPHVASVLANIPSGPCYPSGSLMSHGPSAFPTGPCTGQGPSAIPTGPCTGQGLTGYPQGPVK
jgi:hypothetical protein